MKYLFYIIVLFHVFSSRASHIVGGDVYYDYLGNNTYRFNILLYRDCLSTGAAFDNPLNLGIFATATNALVQEVQVPFPGSQVLPVVFNNPCVTPPTNICTEVGHYQAIVVLPPIQGGYTITYQRCCRGPNVTNLSNPDDTGLTLTCKIPGAETGAWENSSPRYTNYPPLLLCNNDDLIFDHSAVDPDGDQLVYSLVTPFHGGSNINPQPVPPAAPPYSTVVWAGAGFSATEPLGPGATINIHPSSGLLTASPNLTGLFVVGIQVQEIRNGVVINQTIRDFLFRVFNCELQLEAILPEQEDLATFVSYCQGLTVDFENDSYGGTNYAWDFGVPGITTDVSTAFAPSYTYPAPGDYTAMLVINPGWPCTDTAYMDVTVNNELEVSWTVADDSLCIFDNEYDFTATSTGPNGVTYTWDFGPNANQQTGTGQVVNDVSFNTSGYIPVTVDAQVALCDATFTDSIYILPEPTAEMDLPDEIECLGFEIDFGNDSQNATNYEWDFGDGSPVSNDFEPTNIFPGPGTYTVTLTVWSSPSCMHVVQETFTLNEPILVEFTSEESMCFTDNSFNFDGTVSGPPGTVYTWDFGPHASISTSNDIDVSDVTFNTTGTITITLTGVHEDCIETVSHDIYIYTPPTINFTIAPGLQCVPFNAQFIDLSWAETQIFYEWDFGDGGTSNEQNPSHLYTEVGNFPVTLTIHTTEGCIDTLTMLQADIVNVRPRPEAGFTVDKEETDICDSEIQFTNQAIGGAEYFYWFDDSTTFSHEENPNHQYLYDGMHHPYQIVTNEWGCKDTASGQIYIEPFTLFIPNTFTPDANEYNDEFRAVNYLNIHEWEMKIYNRWGEIVFESDRIEESWDGTTPQGVLAQDGVYGYTIRYKTCEPLNPDKFITGHINLIR